MSEIFPHSSHENSDDDAPAPRSIEHAPPPAEVERAPKEQEGTIFSRDELATKARPLFDFIRKQEQREIRDDAPDRHTPELLPSVSAPSEPEVRTYQPPADAEMTQAIHEAAVEDDDDDESESDDHVSTSTVAAPPPVQPPAPQPQELHRPLNEQFEEIIRSEMGEDFVTLTSGERLGEPDSEVLEEEPVSPQMAHAAAAEQGPRRAAPEWAAPAMPEAAATAAEDDAPFFPAGGAPPTPPVPPGESRAFYYEEEEPDDPNAPIPRFAQSTTAYSGGTPSAGGGANTGNGGGSGGNHNAMPRVNNMANMAAFAPGLPRRMERRTGHNARLFVAGFVTGWVIKQYLANNRLARAQKEARKEAKQLNEQIDSAAMEQQTLKRQVRRTEGQLQEVQAAQAVRERHTNEQAQRYEQPGANNQSAERTSDPNQAPVPTAEQPLTQPATSNEEMPLQQAGGTEALAAESTQATAETPQSRSVVAETAPQQPLTTEQIQSARAAAEELVAQAYALQAGQHVEHAAGGGHNIVVDKHGHEVQGAVEYGEEFQFQRRQEQARAGVFASGADEPAAAADSQAYSIVTGLRSGQADFQHSLSSGAPSLTTRQRLLGAKKENPIAATIASPWLWAALFVLLAAFFVAAFI